MHHVHLNAGKICGLAFLPDGKSIIVREKRGYSESSLRWLDRATMQEWAKRETQDSVFTVTPDYLRIAYVTRHRLQQFVEVWDVVRNATVGKLEIDPLYANALCFSPDGEILWLAVEERFDDVWVKWLWTWKIAEGWCNKRTYSFTIGNIACSNNGLWLAVSDEREVQVYDRWNDCIVDNWPRQDGSHRLVFSPHDRYLSTIRSDGAVLWHVKSRQCGPVLGGHVGRINDVDFTADSHIAGTAGDDGVVRLWEAATGRLLRTLSWDIGPLGTLSFSPDGLTGATGGPNGQLLVWDMDDV
jgi:WD40 repeat protein